MIALLGTAPHRETHRVLEDEAALDFRYISYAEAFSAVELPRATYVFSDVDRLGYWELERAARLYRQLRGAGVRALNDPARVRQRYALLRTLQLRGINDFGVWRVEDPGRSPRFPAFLRTESAHGGPLSGLLRNEGDAAEAIESALAEGVPLKELLLVEYAAEPVREGLFRKLAVYRVGERLVPALCVHDPGWAAKTGEEGVAGEALYADELEIVRTNRYADDLRPAFHAGEIEYGRADFGLVGGRVQVYEINTNPRIRQVMEHPSPLRIEAGELAHRLLVEAFDAIDSPPGPPLGHDELGEERLADRLRTGFGFRP